MKNVLIVDDEQAILMAISDFMEEFAEKFTVTTAPNGRIASEILASVPVDLVVTDLKMPEMDGFELLAYMSAHFPDIPAVVMTAFVSPKVRSKLEGSGMLRLLEKPVDFEVLAQVIIRCIEGVPDSGTLTGISLPSFLQLIEMEQTTCLMDVTLPTGRQGLLYFNKGVLYDASFADLRGEVAVYAMLVYDDVKISFRSLPNKTYQKKIKSDLMTVLMEGARRRDEEIRIRKEETARLISARTGDEHTGEAEGGGAENESIYSEIRKGDQSMAEIKEVLEKLKAVGGFMAVGAFTPNGEMVADVNVAGVNLGELGALANDVLLKAQKATEMMNVGRGQVVHVEAPKAHIICRCLNESADFSATAAGKAHLHMVLILNKEDGNIAMGKMRLESVIQEVAVFFR